MNRERLQHLLIGSLSGALVIAALLSSLFSLSAGSTMAQDRTDGPLRTGDEYAQGIDPDLAERRDPTSHVLIKSATPEPEVLLPLLLLQPTPTPTTPPHSILLNGGFEQGRVAWGEYSSNGWPLILRDDELIVEPHNGRWAAWLGGDYYESSILSQLITIAPGESMLHYWYWIGSEDLCNPEYDIAGVLINDTAVDAFLLCEAENTYGWRLRSVNLSAYGGQTVTLKMAAFTDGSLNSNLFLDDISLGSTDLAEGEAVQGLREMARSKDDLLGTRGTWPKTPAANGDYRNTIRALIAAGSREIPIELK